MRPARRTRTTATRRAITRGCCQRTRRAGQLRRLPPNCFAAGTPLLTPDGSKYIEDIRVGDLVLSRDENDPEGPVVARRVLNLFQNYSPLLDLHVGGHVIRTRQSILFGSSAEVGSRRTRLELVSSCVVRRGVRNGQCDRRPDGVGAVFNVEVDDYHTYFVGVRSGE